MHVSRGVFDVETAVRKLSSRFRRTPRVSRSQWPLISAVRPLFYFIRLFGVAPFDISDDQFVVWSYGVAYSVFCSFVQTYLLYMILTRFSTIRNLPSNLELGKVIFNYCIAMYNVGAAVWTRKEFVEVLNILKQFDARIRDLGHPLKERAVTIWVWSSGIYSMVLWIIVNRTGMTAFGESWIDNTSYIVTYIATSMSIVKFSGVVLLLGQRFRHLNEIAQRSKESAATKQTYFAIDCKVIQQLHNGLMNAGESLSSQYSWPISLWLMNLCIHSVSNLYFLTDWLMVTQEWVSARWPYVNCIGWWLVTFITQLLLLHVACHFTSTEANSMGSIVINWKSSAVVRNYRVDPSLHFINRKLNFSAAGCFYVNLPLLRSISALLATYLVLLLQFQS